MCPRFPGFTLSPDQKGIETSVMYIMVFSSLFTLSPDQKGIETPRPELVVRVGFTLSPDQKGIETARSPGEPLTGAVHTEPRSKGD